jgi:hypothetical protein
VGPHALGDDVGVVMRRTSHGASSSRDVPSAMARAIAERPLGALRVTCSARRLEAIERVHGAVIAECELVDRTLPRLVRCVEEEEEKSGPSSSERGLRRSLSSGGASADSEGDGKEDDVPLYARRKWKAPMRLDVKVGAKLGEIESVS